MSAKLLGHSRQFTVYVLGGLLCALIDVGAMQLLLNHGVHLAGATTAGFFAGLLVNYAFHSLVTFGTSASAGNFLRFLCVVALNYLITLACVAAAQALAGMPLAGKAVALVLGAVNGYLLSKYWIFK